MGGSSPDVLACVERPSGGATMGGSSSPALSIRARVDGGVAMGGSSRLGKSAPIVSIGGVTMGGTVVPTSSAYCIVPDAAARVSDLDSIDPFAATLAEI